MKAVVVVMVALVCGLCWKIASAPAETKAFAGGSCGEETLHQSR